LSLILLGNADIMPLVIALDGVLAIVALLDLFSTPSKKSFSVERSCSKIASLKTDHPVGLIINNNSNRSLLLSVRTV
jgi:uncharacterized protein (DUF58 family)